MKYRIFLNMTIDTINLRQSNNHQPWMSSSHVPWSYDLRPWSFRRVQQFIILYQYHTRKTAKPFKRLTFPGNICGLQGRVLTVWTRSGTRFCTSFLRWKIWYFFWYFGPTRYQICPHLIPGIRKSARFLWRVLSCWTNGQTGLSVHQNLGDFWSGTYS